MMIPNFYGHYETNYLPKTQVSYASSTPTPAAIVASSLKATHPPHDQHQDRRARQVPPAKAFHKLNALLEIPRHRSQPPGANRFILLLHWPPVDVIACQVAHRIAHESAMESPSCRQPMSISAKQNVKRDKRVRVGGAAQHGALRRMLMSRAAVLRAWVGWGVRLM
jgi:hypothetical protein